MRDPNFCTTLKSWRKSSHLYQKEAAQILGASLRTYQQWEQGKYCPSELSRIEINRRISNHKPNERAD